MIVFNLDKLLAERKMHSVELAKELDCTVQTISRIKTGKIRAFRISTIDKLCEYFQCQPGDIIEVRPGEKVPVDGRVVNIPSYSVKQGQLVAVREKAKSLEVIQDALAGFNHSKYPWIEWDEQLKGGRMLNLPQREEIPENIKEQLIVELYSK